MRGIGMMTRRIGGVVGRHLIYITVCLLVLGICTFSLIESRITWRFLVKQILSHHVLMFLISQVMVII
jgi:hypothetical protein